MSPPGPQDRQVSVVVVEDYPLYRAGLERLVQSHKRVRLLATVGTGADALRVCRAQRPDVLISDLNLPDMTALDVVGELQDEGISPTILLISGVLENDEVYRCIELGITGVVTKDADAAVIEDAVERIIDGKPVLSDGAQALMLSEVQRRGAKERALLTEREAAVLKLMADGSRVNDVAEALFVSPSTVKTHLESIYRKLDVNDRTAAVAVAIRRNLIR